MCDMEQEITDKGLPDLIRTLRKAADDMEKSSQSDLQGPNKYLEISFAAIRADRQIKVFLDGVYQLALKKYRETAKEGPAVSIHVIKFD